MGLSITDCFVTLLLQLHLAPGELLLGSLGDVSAGGEDKGLVLVVVETQQAGEGHCSDHDVLVTILSLPVLSTS